MEQSQISKISASSLEHLLLDIKEEESFYELYLLLKAPIYSYSLSILKNREDALDNVQDVFITLYHQIDSYQPTQKPMNWIFTITKNAAFSKLRKKKPTVELDENISHGKFQKEEDRLLFQYFMEQLKEEERNIVLLHLLWGFKHREIATILNSNVSTVLSKYHRAIKKLQEMEGFREKNRHTNKSI